MSSRVSRSLAVLACLVLVFSISVVVIPTTAVATSTSPTATDDAALSGPVMLQLGGNESDGPNVPMPGEQGNESESGNETNESGGDNATDGDGGGAGGNDSRVPLPDEQQNESASADNESGDDEWGGGTTGGGAMDRDQGGTGPSPTQWAVDLLTGLLNILLGELEHVIDLYHEWSVGLPAPGVYDDISSWSDPDGAMWVGAQAGHFTSAVLGMLWVVTDAVYTGTKGPKERRKKWTRQGIATVMILGGYHFFAPFYLHLFNSLAIEIAPSGADFTASFGNMARLGLGLFFGGIVVIISSSSFAAGLLSIIFTDGLVYISYAAWGLIWAAWASSGQARGYGLQGIYTFGALGALALMQALVLDVIFNIPWTGSAGPLAALTGTAVGLAIAYIFLPVVFLRQTVSSAAMAIGTGAALASTQIDSAIENHVIERVEQYREETAFSDSSSRPDESGSSVDGSSTVGSGSSSATGSSASTSESGDAGDEWVEQERDRIDYHYN